jgi:hypothetical protein
MPGGYPYLGYPGALQQLPSPAPGYRPEDLLRGGTQELLGGGNVRDRVGRARRRFTLTWPALSDANYLLLRALCRLPGPYRYLDPLAVNLLSANQSTGTDELRTTEGFSARTQGTISSSTALFRSWTRSAAWATGTALSATDRGFVLRTSATVDDTWVAVRPSTSYSVSGYMRTTSAVSMKAGMEWYDSAGVIIGSAVFGTGVAIGTGDFNSRPVHTATSPANAAYAVPLFLNSTSPGTTLTVYLDEPQFQEGAVTAHQLGAGSPVVSVDSFPPSVVLADAATGLVLHEAELVLIEA